jgi:hypothetical protein
VTEIENWITNGENQENELGPSLDDLEPVEGSGGRLRKDGERIIFNFGKYRSRDLQVVANDDPGYIRWLCSPASPLNNDAINLIREMF